MLFVVQNLAEQFNPAVRQILTCAKNYHKALVGECYPRLFAVCQSVAFALSFLFGAPVCLIKSVYVF